MDTNQQISVGSVLQSVAQRLEQNKAGINSLNSGQGGGNHGDRMAQAFQAAAQAAEQSGTNDAGQQFQAAAQALRQNGKGRAIQYYANGLEQAAQQFQGKQGLTASDIGPLLQSLAGGAQQNNPMQPGQGGMLDALMPAAQGFMGAQNQGQGPEQAAIQALSGAVSGAHSTASRGSMDPGAASATNVIGGIITSILPGLLGSFMGGALGGGLGSAIGGGLGGMIGGHSNSGGNTIPSGPQVPAGKIEKVPHTQTPASNANDPLGGLGSILGRLMGGGGNQQGGSPLGGLGGLLGGGGQSPLGGLFGGQKEENQQGDNTKYV